MRFSAISNSDASGGLRQRSLTLTLTPALAKREGVIALTAQQPTPPAPEARPPETQTAPNDEIASPADDAEQSAVTTERDEEIEIVVTGEQETGYGVPNASTATRIDTRDR